MKTLSQTKRHQTYLTSAQLMKRYGGISAMTVWRWEHDLALEFPKPIVIQKRKYWDEAELDDWDVCQSDRSAATTVGGAELNNCKRFDPAADAAKNGARDIESGCEADHTLNHVLKTVGVTR